MGFIVIVVNGKAQDGVRLVEMHPLATYFNRKRMSREEYKERKSELGLMGFLVWISTFLYTVSFSRDT